MQKNHIQTDELNTVSDCLAQLVMAEKSQIDIERQLAQPNRDEEKAYNVQIHQRHNDYLISELKKIVTPSSFEQCVQRATEMLERERNIDAQSI